MSSNAPSRLGQILLGKRLISAAQLDAAVFAQRESGKRLGQILIEQGLLTERQLNRVLRKQNHLRLVATLTAALLSPFQLASAEIAHSASVFQSLPLSLDEQERARRAPAGLTDTLQRLIVQAENGDATGPLEPVARMMLPALAGLEIDTLAVDVQYDAALLRRQLNADGSLRVHLPSSIGEVVLDNIRLRGLTPEQSFSTLKLDNIDLSRSQLTISLQR